jgi:ABC-type glycerol-3-phosphate transport system substrate-binding protein
MGAAAATAFAPYVKRAYAAGPIRVISHRQPALEYYTDQMKKALPEGQVSVELMPIDKEVELASITMSARSDAIDVAYLNDTTMQKFAASGWLEPLDDLWGKYKDEFKLDDFPKSVVDSISYNGRIYSMPILTNTEMFFYREDLFKENSLTLPKTMQEYLEAANDVETRRRLPERDALVPQCGRRGLVRQELEADLQSAGWRKRHRHDEADDGIRSARLHLRCQR